MSLLDQVHKLEQQVVNRLKELEPLTREYDQLRKVAERLGLKYSPGSGQSDDGATPATKPRRPGKRGTRAKPAARRPAKAKAAKPQRTRSTTARTSASTQAAGAGGTAAAARPRKRAATSGRRSSARRAAARPGQRHDDVLRLVRENPGITVRETGERLGVDATGLYRVVKQLSDEGRVRKDGTRLQPVDSAKAAKPNASPDTAKPARAATRTETPDAERSSAAEPSTTVTAGAASRDG